MGSCFSRVGVIRRTSGNRPSSSAAATRTAKVISINGHLREYSTPVLVSDVLAAEFTSSSYSNFLCNSDTLYYDEEIPALSSEEELRPNQIYFLLPASKRQQPLSASDMASLALKATSALHDINNNKKSRVSPLISMFFGFGFSHKHHHPKTASDDGQAQYVHPHDYESDMTIGLTGSIKKKKSTATTATTAAENNINMGSGTMKRSGSVRKLQRFASRRAKLAVRSFRLRLTTIYEGGSIFTWRAKSNKMTNRLPLLSNVDR